MSIRIEVFDVFRSTNFLKIQYQCPKCSQPTTKTIYKTMDSILGNAYIACSTCFESHVSIPTLLLQQEERVKRHAVCGNK